MDRARTSITGCGTTRAAIPEVLAYLEAENAWREAGLAHLAPLTERLYQEFLGRIRQEDASVPYRKRGHWYYSRFEAGDEYSGSCAARGRDRCAGAGPARSARTRPRTRVLRPRWIRHQPRRAPAGLDRGHGRTAAIHAPFPGPGYGSRARATRSPVSSRRWSGQADHRERALHREGPAARCSGSACGGTCSGHRRPRTRSCTRSTTRRSTPGSTRARTSAFS